MLLSLSLMLSILLPAYGSDSELVVEEKREGLPSEQLLVLDERFHANMELGDVLRSSMGSFVRSFGGLGDVSTLSIRGASSRQVELYLDGLPLNPDGVSSINLSELPLHGFSQIQVWRLQPPSWLHSSSMGGAINLIPKSSGKSGALSVGSFGWGRGDLFYGHKGPIEATFFAHFYTAQSDYTYFDNNATPYNLEDDQFRARENNQKQQLSVLGTMRRKNLRLLYSGLMRESGIPGSISMRTRSSSLTIDQHTVGLQAVSTRSSSHHQLDLWSFYRSELYDDRLGEFPSGAQRLENDFFTLGSRAQSSFHLSSELSSSFGLSARYEQIQQSDLLAQQMTRHHRSVGKAQWSLAHQGAQVETLLLLQEVLLIEEKLRTQLNPRFCTTWREGRAAVWAQASRGFRPPDFTELFGQNGTILPNPELRSESSWSAEAGVSAQLRPETQLQLAHFHSWGKDRIVLVQNAQRLALPINFSSTKSMGVELSLMNAFSELLTTETTLNWIHTENRSELASLHLKALPQIPSWSGAQLSLLTLSSWGLGHQLYFSAETYTDATNHFLTPPRMLHNLSLRRELKQAWLELEVRNLTNKISQSSLIDPLQPQLGSAPQPLTDFVGYPMMGRGFYLTLQFLPST